MKITGIRIDRMQTRFTPKYTGEARSVGPLDIYEEYAHDSRARNMRAGTDHAPDVTTALFVVISTDEGIEGRYGPVENRSELLTIVDGIAPHLIGRDPLENRMLWDIISRFDRHSRSGVMMMAISAVDIALWDLKGKILGQPVYKLLGGGRNRVRPYISMLGFSIEPEAVRRRALEVKAMGVRAQKWFFRYGPTDGAEGIRKNLEMAYTLRETLGDGYELMFDCWMGWTIDYAKKVFRDLEAVAPAWVEEVLRPHMVDGYRRLREETTIPLSAGEHLYTRMEVSGYLQEHIFSVMQSDPVWCGGITESVKIADMCEVFGTTFIPHGHSLMPALHVIAAMPPDVCPYCEYLLNFMDKKTAFFRDNRLGEDGWLTLNDTPGLGEEIDEDRLIGVETVRSFDF